MFLINDDDMSIYLTRGDTALFQVSAMKSETERYVFQPGDVVRIKVFEKKACENVVLQKDFGIEEETEFATIQLDERETKIGEVISKPKDYWYEIELNPFTEPQTIVGYDDDGAKVLKLFPEGADVPDVPIEEEDIPIVDSELDLTSTRPVSNHAVSKGFLEVKKNIEDILKITSSAGVHYEELVVVDNETASIKAISNGTNVAVMISVKLSASQVKVYNASILENRDMFEPLNIYEDTKTGILAEMITNGENHKIQFTHNRHNDYDELLLGFTNKTNSEITINHCITYPTKKTSMQEVTDARRDYKGKIYESLGEHVRALGKYSNDNCTDLHTNDDIFLKHIVLSDSEEDETLLMTGEIDRLGIVSDTLMNYAETFSNSENVSISEDGSINFNTPGIYKLNVAMTIENVYSGFDLNISLNGELFNNHFVAKQGTHTYEFDKVVLISRPTTEKLFITDMSSEYLAEITNSVLRVSEPAFIGKVSNEQIEQVVEDYLAENQIEGGATAEQLAQIEQNKKDIGQLSATVNNKLDSFKLPEAINDALAQAKESGEFKGDKGDSFTYEDFTEEQLENLKGDKGDTPVKGTDYFTESDKQEIVDDVLERVEIPSGGGSSGTWRKIAEITLDSEVSTVVIEKDMDDKSFNLKECVVTGVILPIVDSSVANNLAVKLVVGENNSNTFWNSTNNIFVGYAPKSAEIKTAFTTRIEKIEEYGVDVVFKLSKNATNISEQNHSSGTNLTAGSAYIKSDIENGNLSVVKNIDRFEIGSYTTIFGVGTKIMILGVDE